MYLNYVQIQINQYLNDFRVYLYTPYTNADGNNIFFFFFILCVLCYAVLCIHINEMTLSQKRTSN